MRLGVSPAATPTPTGVFNQRFEALFPHTGALGCEVCFAPCHSSQFTYVQMWGLRVLPLTLPALFSTTLIPALSVYLRECGAAGSASGQTACPIGPTLHQSWSLHSHPSPLHPGCPSPSLLLVWMNVYFYFPGVGLPCHLIFCQFWLCKEVQCVYLHRHLGSPVFSLLIHHRKYCCSDQFFYFILFTQRCFCHNS